MVNMTNARIGWAPDPKAVIAQQNQATQPLQNTPVTQPIPITNNTTMSSVGTKPMIGAGAPPTGLIGSEMALNQGVSNAANAITGGANLASQNINQINSAVAPLQGYADQGQAAFNTMSGLTGIGTPAQVEAARAAYQASPAYKYVLGETQRATERSAAARGGLLGGNVARALQENAMGLASTDYQNQFNNLNTVAQTGFGATNAMAGIKADAKNRLADIAQSTGLNLGSLYSGASQDIAAGRTQAGRDIAANASSAASQISQLLKDQGLAVSDLISKDISSITDIIYQSGMQDKIDNQNLAAILANISGGQASNVMQGQSSIGAAQAAGVMGVNNALQGGLQNAIGAGLLG